jgi:putative ABC transport system permease protein
MGSILSLNGPSDKPGTIHFAAREVSSFLFGLSPQDPVTLAAVAAILLATTLVAGYLPARRAARIDPLRAIRCE